MTRKGIILAGGSGSRLHPLTSIVCKQLLPIYDKPMVYYPLSTLMLGGVREILLISTPKDLPQFEALLGDGSQLGLQISYQVQEKPAGIAQALLLAEDFLEGAPSVLILGDNLFYGDYQVFRRAMEQNVGATIFAYHVADPQRFGVVEFDEQKRVLSLEEKPTQPKSSYAVPGLYLYDERAPQFARELKPSPRGELEITDLNRCYLELGQLHAEVLGRGIAWLDTGTPQSLLEASSFVATLERQQNFRIACLEEIAWRKRWISRAQFQELAQAAINPANRAYLQQLLADNPSEFPR